MGDKVKATWHPAEGPGDEIERLQRQVAYWKREQEQSAAELEALRAANDRIRQQRDKAEADVERLLSTGMAAEAVVRAWRAYDSIFRARLTKDWPTLAMAVLRLVATKR